MRAGAPQDQDGPTDAIRGAALITVGGGQELGSNGTDNNAGRDGRQPRP